MTQPTIIESESQSPSKLRVVFYLTPTVMHYVRDYAGTLDDTLSNAVTDLIYQAALVDDLQRELSTVKRDLDGANEAYEELEKDYRALEHKWQSGERYYD